MVVPEKWEVLVRTAPLGRRDHRESMGPVGDPANLERPAWSASKDCLDAMALTECQASEGRQGRRELKVMLAWWEKTDGPESQERMARQVFLESSAIRAMLEIGVSRGYKAWSAMLEMLETQEAREKPAPMVNAGQTALRVRPVNVARMATLVRPDLLVRPATVAAPV